MLFRVQAVAVNGGGPFDAAYDFGSGVGEEGGMVGSPEEIGQELTRFLASLTPEDCQQMEYGTGYFAIELKLVPLKEG